MSKTGLLLAVALAAACGDDDPNRRPLPDASPALLADAAPDAYWAPKPDAAPPPPAWPVGLYDLKFNYTGSCPGGDAMVPKWTRLRLAAQGAHASMNLWREPGQAEADAVHAEGIYDDTQELVHVGQTLVASNDVCAVIVKPWTAFRTILGFAGQIEVSFVGECFPQGDVCHPGEFFSWTVTGSREKP